MKINDPTHKKISTSRRFSWALAASLALGTLPAPTARAATDTANAAALSTNLPPKITLARASVAQVAAALHEAVKQHHDDAVDLLRIAILAKTPKQGHGELSCEDLKRLVQAAATAAPDKTSQLVDMAASLHPDCADGLQNLLAGALGASAAGGPGASAAGGPGANAAGGPGGDATGGPGGDDTGGLGNGVGPGFPGSPGFVGSPPSGSVALPIALPSPNATPVTSTTND